MDTLKVLQYDISAELSVVESAQNMQLFSGVIGRIGSGLEFSMSDHPRP